MKRALAVVLAALAAAPVAAAGGPQSLRVARPADASPFAGSPVETWRVVVVSPRARSSLLLEIVFQRQPGDAAHAETGATLTYWPGAAGTGGVEAWADLGLVPRAGPGVAARGVSVSYAESRWTVALDQPTATLSLVLRDPLPGVTATRWPIGEQARPSPHLATFDWSAPVATARADGVLEWRGRRVAIAGWRASVDHTWGQFDFGAALMQHWDWAAVQDASGGWLVDGFETGPGITQWKPHDAQWSGVLVHATARGATFCRAAVRRGGWQQFYAGVDGFVYPETLIASCAGARLSIARLTTGYDYAHGIAASAVTSPTGGYGLFYEWESTG